MLLKWNYLGLDALQKFNPVVEEFIRLGLVIDNVPSCSHGGPKTVGAYLLLHLRTKKVYVGSHMNLYSRKYQHDFLLKRGIHFIKEFQEAFNEDQRLIVMFIGTTDREQAYDLEQHILDKFYSTGLLFNVAKNARLANKDLPVSDETRRKLSIAAKGRVQNAEWIKKRTQHLIGRKLNDETIEKIRNKAKERGINPQMTLLAKAKVSKPVMVDGQKFDSIVAAACKYGISQNAASKRIHSKNPLFSGWQFAESQSTI